jgi:hypothetical protein
MCPVATCVMCVPARLLPVLAVDGWLAATLLLRVAQLQQQHRAAADSTGSRVGHVQAAQAAYHLLKQQTVGCTTIFGITGARHLAIQMYVPSSTTVACSLEICYHPMCKLTTWKALRVDVTDWHNTGNTTAQKAMPAAVSVWTSHSHPVLTPNCPHM